MLNIFEEKSRMDNPETPGNIGHTRHRKKTGKAPKPNIEN
jgi:hypothetical protein